MGGAGCARPGPTTICCCSRSTWAPAMAASRAAGTRCSEVAEAYAFMLTQMGGRMRAPADRRLCCWLLAALAAAAGRPAARSTVAVTASGDELDRRLPLPARRRRLGVRPLVADPRAASSRGGRRAGRSLTPGVRLERRGHYDVLVVADGGRVPKRVRVRFTPFTGRSDRRIRSGPGVHRRLGRAVQRAVRRLSARSAAAAARAAGRPQRDRSPAGPTRVTFATRRPVLHDGRRHRRRSRSDERRHLCPVRPAEPVVDRR